MVQAAPPTAAAKLVGAVLNGRWRLVRLLGEGGMGAVYEADGVRGEGKRAIKMLHAELVREEQIVQRFFAEAQACRALRHANVAQIHDAATAEDGTPYLVMELLTGIPLSAYLDQSDPIPAQHAVPIVHGVLQALAVAHAQRIVHRDLKPDNLFLVRGPSGAYTVKVLDFGIAKVMDAAGGMGAKTRTGVLLGTPGYMSPEQVRNSKGVDPRSDLWAVGVILYEMLTAKAPFVADSELGRLTAVLTEEPQPIERVAPALSAWTPFFERALAKNPAERFQSADEMARALVGVSRDGAPVSAHADPATLTTDLGARALAPVPPVPAVPTHISGPKPAGAPTIASAEVRVEVVRAPPIPRRVAPLWAVFVVGLAALGLGFAAGVAFGGR